MPVTTLNPAACLQIGNKDMLNCYYAHAEEGEHAQMVRLQALQCGVSGQMREQHTGAARPPVHSASSVMLAYLSVMPF